MHFTKTSTRPGEWTVNHRDDWDPSLDYSALGLAALKISTEIINYGHCKALGVDVMINATLQVNPLAHFFAGSIPRMINGYVYFISDHRP